ncbi:hypothetical protein HP397_01825 [Streptobacillus felis]|uniref:Uncharacterized protein n=1 Tax=Streptobacillus felis TaxID=1384509 RepID=A0A7Z0PE92_9FUSO|nr:hypothetical protein [Streptobacillus felis]NYV27567.1 hypothetical protein [Streptobacillus felis]
MITAIINKIRTEEILESIVKIFPFTFLLNLIPFFTIDLSFTGVFFLLFIFILQYYVLYKMYNILDEE